MIKRFLLPILFGASVGVVIFSAQANAGVVGFNPGRIIDDMIFTNNTSMNAGDIQNFLNSKVPVCDTWGTQMYTSWQTRAQYAATVGQSPPFTCVKDYRENNLSAAQIIYNISQTYRINPQVLIVLLQKEQGLVTDSWPYASQYRTATGYGCPDTAACDTKYYGFTNQVTWAAKMFRSIMDASPNWYTPYVVGNNYIQYSPSASCGGTVVNIQNRATQALYNYTPYQPNQATLDAGWGTASCGAYGNRNFYLYFTSWFGVTTGTPLVQAPSSNAVYLLSNNKRFLIPNGDIIYAYGMQSVQITAVSDNFIDSVPDGGVLSTIFTLPGDGTVYIADLGNKIAISSGTYCVRWGLPCGNATYQHELGPEFRTSMRDTGMLQPVMKFANRYYLMQDGKKLPFTSPQALQENGYSETTSTLVGNWTNVIREFGIALPANNTFIKFVNSPSIYLYSNKLYYSFPSYDSFVGWSGPSSTSVLDKESSYNATPPPVSGILQQIVKSTDGTISLLTYAKRYILTGASPSTTAMTDLTNNPALSTTFASRPVQTITSNNALGVPNGTIFKLEGATLRPFPTLSDLYLEFTDKDIVVLPLGALDAYAVGKLTIPAGRIVKPGDGGAMYVYGADKNLWALGSLNELWATNSWLNNGAAAIRYENLEMQGIKIYAGVVSVNNAYYIVSNDGILHEIAKGSLGLPENAMPLSGAVSSRLKFSTPPASFIRFDNGTIFYILGDGIHPLASMSAYYRLGGTPANTVALPLKALSLFKVGNVTY